MVKNLLRPGELRGRDGGGVAFLFFHGGQMRPEDAHGFCQRGCQSSCGDLGHMGTHRWACETAPCPRRTLLRFLLLS